MSDLLERHRLVAAKAIVHHQHLALPRTQNIHRAIERCAPRLILERRSSAWSVLRRLDGDHVRQRQSRRITSAACYRLVERMSRLRESADAANQLDVELRDLRHLIVARLTSQLVTKNVLCARDARHIRRAAQRDTNGMTVLRYRRRQRLTNPPNSVADEIDAYLGIILVRGAH